MDVRPFWLAGRPATGDAELTVTNPHDGRVVGRLFRADRRAGRGGRRRRRRRCAAQAAALPLHVRAEALAHVSRRLAERADEIAQLITAENGKPIFWARGEVGRAVSTFRFAAEETRRWSGERAAARHRARRRRAALAYVSRVPYGPVLGDHAVQLPAQPGRPQGRPGDRGRRARSSSSRRPATPLSALLLGELLAETDLPAGHVLGAAGPERPGRRAGRRPAAAGGLVHRLRPGRLRDHATGPAQARDARARRQRRGGRAAPTPTSTGPPSGSRCSPTTRPGRAASPCSG